MPRQSSIPLNHESRTRGYLPHIEGPSEQSITYRLADALPAEVIAKIEEQSLSESQKRIALECYLDAGHGSCILRQPDIAHIVIENWLHFHRQRYAIIAFAIMPNHAHILIELPEDQSLSGILHSWKSYTAKRILDVMDAGGPPALPGRQIWQEEYWDRWMRDGAHLRKAIRYIHQNPVAASLCRKPEDWPFSTANPAIQNLLSAS